MKIGERIKARRNAQGLTQHELAKQAGIATGTMSSYESGGKMPPLDVAYRLAQALNVTTDWLCTGAEEELHARFNTYGDFARAFIRMREVGGAATASKTKLDIQNDQTILHSDWDYYRVYDEDGEEHYCKSEWGNFSVRDSIIATFLEGWGKTYGLLKDGTIDKELYSLWLEKKLKELDVKVAYTFDPPAGFTSADFLD